jgi:hypothetical protein
MEFAAQARAELMPLIDRVLDLAGGRAPVSAPAGDEAPAAGVEGMRRAFAEAADLPLRAFFTGILLQAQAMREEEDVLALFFELSTSAFLGFQYSPEVARAIDDLLGAAERIAFTMTAPVEHPH